MSFNIKPEKNYVEQTQASTPTADGLIEGTASSSSTNTGVGYNALAAAHIAGASTNKSTAVGYEALKNMQQYSDGDNTAVGHKALQSLVNGNSNTAIGTDAMMSASNASRNVAVGDSALKMLESGADNIAIGWLAMNNAVTSSTQGNIAVGTRALQFHNSQGEYAPNVAIGLDALSSLTTGGRNVAVGYQSMLSLGTGANNTALGSFSASAMSGSASNNTVIGYSSGVSPSSASNQIVLGNSSITTLRCQVTSITALSDERDKTNIEDSGFGLGLINELRPVVFEWNMRDGGKVGVKDIGFIAQEMIAVEDELDAHETLRLTYRDNPEQLEASYGRLIPILVKAVQELSARLDALE